MSRALWVIHERLKKYSLAGAMMMVLQLWFLLGGVSTFVAGGSFSNGGGWWHRFMGKGHKK